VDVNSGSTIAVIVGVVGLFVAVWVALFSVIRTSIKAASRFSRIEDRVQIMWDFLFRRAIAEAVDKGIARMNSPVTVNDVAKSWMKDFKTDLQALYRSLGPAISDADLALEIERKFGERIVREVCIPQGLHSGECLVVAIAVAKEPVSR
jgi:hypothetical protein